MTTGITLDIRKGKARTRPPHDAHGTAFLQGGSDFTRRSLRPTGGRQTLSHMGLALTRYARNGLRGATMDGFASLGFFLGFLFLGIFHGIMPWPFGSAGSAGPVHSTCTTRPQREVTGDQDPIPMLLLCTCDGELAWRLVAGKGLAGSSGGLLGLDATVRFRSRLNPKTFANCREGKGPASANQSNLLVHQIMAGKAQSEIEG